MTGHLRRLGALALVAAGAAVFAVIFRLSLTWIYAHLYGASNVLDVFIGLPPALRFGVPVFAACLAGAISRLRQGSQQGVSNVMEAVAVGRVRLSLRTTASRVLSSWVAMAGGLSVGREGPLIEVGGAIGAAVGRRAQVSATDLRVLVAAGTAAGFAAAYNTPFAATVYVLECLAGVVAPALVLPVMFSTVIASVLTRAVVGAGPIYGQRAFGLSSADDFAWCGVLGVLAALVAIAFKRLLNALETWQAAHPVPQPLRATLGGVVVGTIAMWLPAVVGNGYEPLNRLLNAPMLVGAAATLLGAKIFATSVSVSSGIPGGIFTPMLLVGAALGSVWAHVLHAAIGAPLNVGAYALVGMAATTAASIHAPLTAAVLIFELSTDYALVLPVLLATVVATAVSRIARGESIYETELRKRGLQWDVTLEGQSMRPTDRT